MQPPQHLGLWPGLTLSNTAKACLIGQLLSLLLAVMGTTSGILAAAGINAPTTQSFFNYCLLAVTCGAIHLYRSGGRWSLTNPVLAYLVLAVLDVEGNYLVTLAYQYTSVTSVTLLDSATIPFVMVLSAIVFRSQYRLGHMVGCLLCTGGLLVLVLTDSASETGGNRPLLGDALVVAGAAVYAVCNIAQEKLLSDTTSRWELLAMLGLFGSCVSGTQALILERSAWQQAIAWGPGAGVAFAAFALALYTFYVLVPDVLILGSSTILNLSLLTSDLWAAVARLVMFGGFGGTAWAFAVALAAEATGLGLYAASGETHRHPHPQTLSGGSAAGRGSGSSSHVAYTGVSTVADQGFVDGGALPQGGAVWSGGKGGDGGCNVDGGDGGGGRGAGASGQGWGGKVRDVLMWLPGTTSAARGRRVGHGMAEAGDLEGAAGATESVSLLRPWRREQGGDATTPSSGTASAFIAGSAGNSGSQASRGAAAGSYLAPRIGAASPDVMAPTGRSHVLDASPGSAGERHAGSASPQQLLPSLHMAAPTPSPSRRPRGSRAGLGAQGSFGHAHGPHGALQEGSPGAGSSLDSEMCVLSPVASHRLSGDSPAGSGRPTGTGLSGAQGQGLGAGAGQGREAGQGLGLGGGIVVARDAGAAAGVDMEAGQTALHSQAENPPSSQV